MDSNDTRQSNSPLSQTCPCCCRWLFLLIASSQFLSQPHIWWGDHLSGGRVASCNFSTKRKIHQPPAVSIIISNRSVQNGYIIFFFLSKNALNRSSYEAEYNSISFSRQCYLLEASIVLAMQDLDLLSAESLLTHSMSS